MRRKVLILILTLPVLFIAFSCNDAESAGAGYIGSEICSGCHSGIYENFAESVHGRKSIPESPANRKGCESCHGPGEDHVIKAGGRGVEIFSFVRKVPGYERSAKCLACHEESKTVAFWDMSRHKLSDVACDDCHSVHFGSDKALKTKEPDLCFTCHRAVMAQSNRQSRHPVKDGRMKCSDCHEVMGGFGEKQVKADSVNELCYSCHAEKRGPFLWEHPPVDENCLKCHVPHGSSHSKLLQKKVPYLCHSCHSDRGHPGSIHTNFETFGGSATSGKNRMFARACLNCHSNIHGSNGPSARGSHWVR
jgi:DmsE family decaheme c-type cytochrome